MRAAVVVVGGAGLDIVARSDRRVQVATSNPGRTRTTAGGVGRNVAENLARLGTRTMLVAALGDDAPGLRVRDQTAAAGVDLTHVLRTEGATGTYTAVLDADGELVVAVADMTATEQLQPAQLPMAHLAAADFVVVDGNLPVPVIERALDASTPLLLDPVSAPKARRLAGLLGHRLHTVTPDRQELAALSGRPVEDERQIASAAESLLARGVERVWVRGGALGSTLFRADGATPIPAYPARPVDVTGAGDAMLAAYVHGLLAGSSDRDAACDGAAAAYLTITCPHTVRPDLSPELIARVPRDHP